MTRNNENGRSRLPTLLAALAAIVTMAAGCATDMPTAASEAVEDDCYLINGQWHCPHGN